MLFFYQPVEAKDTPIAPQTLVTVNVTNLYVETVKAVSLPEVKQPEPQPKPAPKPRTVSNLTVRRASTISGFRWGWCTYYAASKFPVTWRGNAAQWGSNAAAQGYRVDRAPETGALLVTYENSRGCRGCGHVAYIDKVENGIMYISEMNYAGFGKVSSRQLSVDSGIIKAVIHRN